MAEPVGIQTTIGELREFCRDSAFWSGDFCDDAVVSVGGMLYEGVVLRDSSGATDSLIMGRDRAFFCTLSEGRVFGRIDEYDIDNGFKDYIRVAFERWREERRQPKPQLSKLAKQFVEELSPSSLWRNDSSCKARYGTIRRLFLASGLQGEDSRAVDKALSETAKLIGLEYTGKAAPW